MKYEPIIGLEIHVQLKTKSKMFCSCDNTGENQPPNTTVCPICMGHPGVLPVANKQAIEWSALAGLALNCEIPDSSKFDRKNYFYPDLPKAYQISQFDEPIAINGFLDVEVPSKKGRERTRIGITRAHLEEDAAKNIHGKDKDWSYIDYNRCGTPLLEIVTEPDFRSPAEAKVFLQELRLIMRYLRISDADMEKGHLRCDANISLRKAGETKLNPKIEVKNLNSFKSVERALEYEIKRQSKLDKLPENQSTRGWNEKKGATEEQRTKEEAHDYRYFPEPDLPPLDLGETRKKMKGNLPELPQAKRVRFIDEYDLSYSDAKTITEDRFLADYTEQVFSELQEWLPSLEEVDGTKEEIWKKNKKKLTKLVSGWLLSKLGGLMAENKISIRTLKIDPENFAEFVALIYTSKLSGPAAMKVLEEMVKTGADPTHVMDEKRLGQMGDKDELEEIVENIIKNNPSQVKEYKAGKIQVVQFLMGVAMKETEGRANPKIIIDLLKKKMK
ncbi:MAG: Asp-tRNA(Asn)/Glu-tRNA(Gln) amidotransferase subunit GatB [Parcubacteria group bacterium]|nr:Asp-tRNA(Asn)/Glu-tRNA(Gln) amidotransferase subunit GatB [Parcubacteria group bacterium]